MPTDIKLDEPPNQSSAHDLLVVTQYNGFEVSPLLDGGSSLRHAFALMHSHVQLGEPHIVLLEVLGYGPVGYLYLRFGVL